MQNCIGTRYVREANMRMNDFHRCDRDDREVVFLGFVVFGRS